MAAECVMTSRYLKTPRYFLSSGWWIILSQLSQVSSFLRKESKILLFCFRLNRSQTFNVIRAGISLPWQTPLRSSLPDPRVVPVRFSSIFEGESCSDGECCVRSKTTTSRIEEPKHGQRKQLTHSILCPHVSLLIDSCWLQRDRGPESWLVWP